MKLKRFVKEQLKSLLQHTALPLVYALSARKGVQKGLVIFADAHHNSLPFNMKMMYAGVKKLPGVTVKIRCFDFQKNSLIKLVPWLVGFMRLYARAEYVFISDNFLPVSSCKKRSETTVVQLWHSGGLLKKSGYDTPYSVPDYYNGNVFKNYDLLTVSAVCCVPVFTKMMRQPEGAVKALGVSRTDIFFNKKYNDRCVKEFYERYPEAEGKKIILYAPTFRGGADEPETFGEELVDKAFEGKNDYFLVKKLHPHFENKNEYRKTCDIPSERLLPVADLLVTDYSSVLFDYILYEKPFVMFTPDFDEYEKKVGFYADINKFPTTVVKDADKLVPAVEYELNNRSKAQLREFREYHMGACDGRATKKIMKEIGLAQ